MQQLCKRTYKNDHFIILYVCNKKLFPKGDLSMCTEHSRKVNKAKTDNMPETMLAVWREKKSGMKNIRVFAETKLTAK